MSRDLPKSFPGPVTATGTTAQFSPGTRRFESGREYVYVKAGSGGLAANEACEVDATDLTGGTVKVSPNTAAGCVLGISETAIAAASYGWITVRGVASAKVADGVAARDILGATTTAGVLDLPANTVVMGLRIVALEANATGDVAVKAVYLV